MGIKQKLAEIKILKSWVVFMMDIIISVVATLFALYSVDVFLNYDVDAEMTIRTLILSLVGSILSFYFLRTYRIVIRHSTFRDILSLSLGALSKIFIVAIIYVIFWRTELYPINIFIAGALLDLLLTLVLLVIARLALLFVYDAIRKDFVGDRGENILIYGMGVKSAGLIAYFNDSQYYNVKGFLAYDTKNPRLEIGGHRVYGFTNEQELEKVFTRVKVKYVIFPTYSELNKETDRLVKISHKLGIELLISPRIDQVNPNNGVLKLGIREIKIEDLLGRSQIRLDLTRIKKHFQGKTVLVTGAAGSIGSEICRQLADIGVSKLLMFDSAETPLHEHRIEMDEKYGRAGIEIIPVVGDVRLKSRLDRIFDRFRPDVVFHAAAYKHVPLMEDNPCEGVYVNVVGTRHVADMAVKYGVEKFVMVSTYKAVNPTNVMGATKRAAEIYIQTLGREIKEGRIEGKTKFVTTRFGNVSGSNGSVIPHFRKQIEQGGPLTVTSSEITRFFMSIPEACHLVLEAGTMGDGCEIFVFDMGEPVKIIDMARRMIELAGYKPDVEIKIEITGLRPGEKLYEEVLNNGEDTMATDNKKIMIAQTRSADYAEVCSSIDRLETLARNVEILETVRELKDLIPEFVSQNSWFEELDK